MAEEHIKGAVVLIYLEVVEKTIGRDAYAKIMDGLSNPMKGALASLHAAAWAPEQLLGEVIGLIVQHHGVETVRKIGHDQQMAMTKRTHAFFGRIVGPRNLVKMAARVWTQFRDTGSASADMVNDKCAKLIVTGNQSMHMPGCADSFAGSCTAAIETTRATNVRATFEMNSDKVVFEFRWD